MPSEHKNEERRQFIRIKKNYIIRFCEKNNPSIKFDVSQIENISKGGLCFTSTMLMHPGTSLSIELRTPFVADTIFLEGKVLSSHEKIRGIIYSNHVKFADASPEALLILEKIERYNINQADKK